MMKKSAITKVILWAELIDMMVFIIVHAPTGVLPCPLQLKWRARETRRLQKKERLAFSVD